MERHATDEEGKDARRERGRGGRGREKEYDVPPGNGFSLLTASLKRGIINISFLQIVPDMQDTSALRAQEDIASDI